MSSTPEHEFQQRVRASLVALEPALTQVLASLIHHEYPNEVVALHFEVFSDGFASGFPARAFFLDRRNTEYFLWVDGQATYPSPVDPGLLAIECTYPREFEDALTVASPESDPWEMATSELVDWFLGCWRNAGGERFRLAATLAHHDSGTELNLVTGRTQARGSAFA